MPNVVIVNSGRQYVRMMIEAGFEVASCNSMTDIQSTDWSIVDMVLFTGGADVNPALYGHTKHPTTHYHDAYDLIYSTAFKAAREANKDVLMVGICRGSQFLCVAAGGTLIQDLHGHTSEHRVVDLDGEEWNVTSTHHQMQYPVNVKHEVLANCYGIAKNPVQHIDGEEVPVQLNMDYEAVYYPDTHSFAFQPHPEFQAGECRQLFFKLLDYVQAK